VDILSWPVGAIEAFSVYRIRGKVLRQPWLSLTFQRDQALRFD